MQNEKIKAAEFPLSVLMRSNARMEYPVNFKFDEWFKHEWEIGQRIIRHLLADIAGAAAPEGREGTFDRRDLLYCAGLLGISAAWLRVYEPDCFGRPETVYPVLTAGPGPAAAEKLALKHLFLSPDDTTAEEILTQFRQLAAVLEQNSPPDTETAFDGTSAQLLENMTAMFYYGVAFWKDWPCKDRFRNSRYLDPDAIPALAQICSGEAENFALKPEKRVWLVAFKDELMAQDFCNTVNFYCNASAVPENPHAIRSRFFVRATYYA